MRGNTLNMQITQQFFVEECCNCGVMFALTVEFQDNKKRDKTRFYCPNGHGQSYTGITDEEKARRALVAQRAAEDQARAAEAARAREETARKKAQAEAKRLKARAAGGACPHCNRTFVQLARHVATKHPECVS
jgi:Zn ribbon nucleic-acid-binding protein